MNETIFISQDAPNASTVSQDVFDALRGAKLLHRTIKGTETWFGYDEVIGGAHRVRCWMRDGSRVTVAE